jgi:hypothetical protein
MRPPSTRRALLAGAFLVAAALLIPAVTGAIYVSPTTVFMDERSRETQVLVGNSGDAPEEATIELRFGFPDADSAGTPYVRFVDDPGPEFPSAAEWIRPFPLRMRLEPRTQQVVRLLARPPADLPDGEYWTRMIVTGRGAYAQLQSGDTALRAGVSLEIRLVTSVTYRKGRLSTRAVIRSVAAEAEGDSLAIWASLAREGNAAYLGTADVELINAAGRIVNRWSTGLAIYYPMRRRFAYPIPGLAPGDYVVRFRLRSQRRDLPSERVLSAPTVVDSVAVRVF